MALATHAGMIQFAKLAADPTGGDLIDGLMWYNTTSDKFKFYDGAAVQVLENDKNNYAATVAPAATDDGPDGGYVQGSEWFNTTTNILYVCVDNTDDAAIWAQVSSPRSECGEVAAGAFTIAAGSAATLTVTFANTYLGTPQIFLQPVSATGGHTYLASVINVTGTTFDIELASDEVDELDKVAYSVLDC